MSAPSLFVLFVGGWGAAEAKKENLFYQPQFRFLEDAVSRYPSISLESTKTLSDFYQTIGQAMIPSILHDHQLKQVVISDADRFGFLTEVLSGGKTEPFEGDHWKYVELPPIDKLSGAPDTSLDSIVKLADEEVRHPQNKVIFASVNALWSVAGYNQLSVIQNSLQATHTAITKLIDRVTASGMHMLILSDGGMIESCIDKETSAISAERSDAALPCILISKELEGLKGEQEDWGEDGIVPLKPAGTVEDIAPTILALTQIPVPKAMPGKILFPDCISSI
jgi:2,3-bisphosphoglycerate-independent phosphoglycerate mutase